MKKSIQIKVKGIVQQVGFRKFSKAQADKFHISGYAQNQLDGSVKICAYGEEKDIEAFISALKVGPSKSQVKSVEFEIIPDSPSDSFEIIQ